MIIHCPPHSSFSSPFSISVSFLLFYLNFSFSSLFFPGGQWGEDDDLFEDEEGGGGGGGKKKASGNEEGSREKEGGKGWAEDDDLDLSDEDEATPQRRGSKVR